MNIFNTVTNKIFGKKPEPEPEPEPAWKTNPNADEETELREGTDMKANFDIHSGWGDHIEWRDDTLERFKQPLTLDSVFDVWGHLPVLPEVGNTLMSEFKKTWMKFVFIEVERCDNPRDMFFAKVKIVAQILKS
jgi:hypothetical protein